MTQVFFNPAPKPPKTEKKEPKPPNKVNRKRKAKLFEEDFGGKEYRAFIKSLPCAICGVEGFSDPAHVKSRGAGGKADDLVPLCRMPRPVLWGAGCHQAFDLRIGDVRLRHEERLQALSKELWEGFKSRKVA